MKFGTHRNFQITYMKEDTVNNVLCRQFKNVPCLHKHIRKKQKCPDAPFELQKLVAVYQNLEIILKLFVGLL